MKPNTFLSITALFMLAVLFLFGFITFMFMFIGFMFGGVFVTIIMQNVLTKDVR